MRIERPQILSPISSDTLLFRPIILIMDSRIANWTFSRVYTIDQSLKEKTHE